MEPREADFVEIPLQSSCRRPLIYRSVARQKSGDKLTEGVLAFDLGSEDYEVDIKFGSRRLTLPAICRPTAKGTAQVSCAVHAIEAHLPLVDLRSFSDTYYGLLHVVPRITSISG